MELRRFNSDGLEAFRTYLEALPQQTRSDGPHFLLDDAKLTEPVKPAITTEAQAFKTRYELAQYLYKILHGAGLEALHQDKGLWAWLAAFHFDLLCPPKSKGRRQPGEIARWILNPSSFRFYRHLLAGPYFVYRQHADKPERTLGLLCSPPHQMNDPFKYIAGIQSLVRNPAVVETATRLYYNPNTGRLKRGAGNKSDGSVRRMVEVLGQLDCTWDLYSLTADQVLDLLPAEFDRYKHDDALALL